MLPLYVIRCLQTPTNEVKINMVRAGGALVVQVGWDKAQGLSNRFCPCLLAAESHWPSEPQVPHLFLPRTCSDSCGPQCAPFPLTLVPHTLHTHTHLCPISRDDCPRHLSCTVSQLPPLSARSYHSLPSTSSSRTSWVPFSRLTAEFLKFPITPSLLSHFIPFMLIFLKCISAEPLLLWK